MQGEYSIIKYVPQPERGESVNLGVVLVSGSQGQVWTCFRDSSSFNDYPAYLRPAPEIIRSFENNLHNLPQERSSGEISTLLTDLKHDLQNSIQTGEPHPCNFDDPNGFLHSIFEKLVLPPRRAEAEKKTSRRPRN